MNEKLTDKHLARKAIAEGLRDTIKTHGPITKSLIGSAVKRIVGILFSKGENK